MTRTAYFLRLTHRCPQSWRASATKLIEIINIDVPTVELGSVATKYNVQNKVTINGIVTAIDDPVIAKWYSTSAARRKSYTWRVNENYIDETYYDYDGLNSTVIAAPYYP